MASYDFTTESGISSAASDLAASVQAAIKSAEASSASDGSDGVQEFSKTVRKSSSTIASKATDIGVLAKNTTRLNVVSNLEAKDNVDFYKFRVANTGEPTLANVGDEGARIQVMTRLGSVIADSNTDSGSTYDAYQSLQKGELTLDSGDYTIRVTRDKGVDAGTPLNYALQLGMGSYTQDFDTIAQQADKSSEDTVSLSADAQGLMSMLSSAVDTTANGLFTAGQGTASSSDLIGTLFDGYV
ncbi:hypothetical protein M2352_001421 [Azospirillum fermentarium]|uniref:hypothetical protein n=1 Tax=Azospirillum fermentarium TaxID=1233114 RepID=UPI002226E21B|nr:hypothetical protein [Azospirillum fermentarium]MCW2245830.1 hypothetical protein [Azospirillum fermentarium]